MNYIDLILLTIIGLLIWYDYKRGFIASSLILVSWIGSLFLAFVGYATLSGLLHKIIPPLGYWAEPVSFMLLLMLSRLLLDRLTSRVIDEVSEETHEHIVNKLFGIVPGITNGLIWAALIATIFLLMPLTRISEETRESEFSESLITRVSWLEAKLAPIFGEALNRTVRKTTINDETTGTVKLPFIVKQPKERPELAHEMLLMVNEERVKRGFKPLKPDPEMELVALKHSADMFARGYFSHYTPEGLNPFDRMKRDRVKFYIAGENLALSQTLQMAHTGLMNSPGHKANILNPAFGRLGIGILDGGIYGLIITQNFRN